MPTPLLEQPAGSAARGSANAGAAENINPSIEMPVAIARLDFFNECINNFSKY
jgi:hypothetical protein